MSRLQPDSPVYSIICTTRDQLYRVMEWADIPEDEIPGRNYSWYVVYSCCTEEDDDIGVLTYSRIQEYWQLQRARYLDEPVYTYGQWLEEIGQ